MSNKQLYWILLGNIITLQWCHNGRDGVSNHHPHHCLLNRLFGRRSKKTSKLRVTVLCAGNSPVTGEFPTQMASNAENVSIWWRHHEHIEIWTKTTTFCEWLLEVHFLNESLCILMQMSLMIFTKGSVDIMSVLVWIILWFQTNSKPLRALKMA